MEYQYAPKQSKRADVREKLTQESLRADLFETNMRNTIAVVMNSKEYELETKKQSLQVILDKLLKNKAELSEKFYEDTLDDVKTKIARNDIEITRRVIQQNKKKSMLMEAPKGLLKDIHSIWKDNSIFNPIDTSINLVKGILHTIPKNLISSIVATDGNPEAIKRKINDLLATKDKLFSIIRHADNMEDINLKNETFQLLKNINKEVEALELELFSQGFERAIKKKKKQYTEKNVTAVKKGKKKFEFTPEDDFEYTEKIKKSNKVEKKSQTVNDIRVEGEDELFTEKVIQSLQKYDFDEVKYIQKLRRRLDAVEKLERGDDNNVVPLKIPGTPGVDVDKDGKKTRSTKLRDLLKGLPAVATRGANPYILALTGAYIIAEADEYFNEKGGIGHVIIESIKQMPEFADEIQKAAVSVSQTALKKIEEASDKTLTAITETANLAMVTLDKNKNSFFKFVNEQKKDLSEWWDKAEFNPINKIANMTQSKSTNNKPAQVGLVDLSKSVTSSISTNSTKQDVELSISTMTNQEMLMLRNEYITLITCSIEEFEGLDNEFKKKVLLFAKLYSETYSKDGKKEKLIVTAAKRLPKRIKELRDAWFRCKNNNDCADKKRIGIETEPSLTSSHAVGRAIDVSRISYSKPGFDNLLKKAKLYRPFPKKIKNKTYDPVHIISTGSLGKTDIDWDSPELEVPPIIEEDKPKKEQAIDLSSLLNKAEKDQTENYYRKITDAAMLTMKGDILVNPSFEQHNIHKKAEAELESKREKERKAFNKNERLVSIKAEITKRDPGLNYDESNKLANQILDEESKKGELFVNIKRNIEVENPRKSMKEILSIANSSYDNMIKDVSAENFSLTTFTNIYAKTSLDLDNKYEKNHKNISIEAMNVLRREKMDKKFNKSDKNMVSGDVTIETKSSIVPPLPKGEIYKEPEKNTITPIEYAPVINVDNKQQQSSNNQTKKSDPNIAGLINIGAKDKVSANTIIT